MTPSPRTGGIIREAGLRILGTPLLVKIIGIGGVVGIIFGAVVGYQVQETMAERLYRDLADTASVGAGLLSESLTRPLVIEDLATVRQVVRNGQGTFPDLRLILVVDARRSIVAHSFPGDVPQSVQGLAAGQPAGSIRKVLVGEDLVIVSTAPILEGRAGYVQVGLSDAKVLSALDTVRTTLLWTLAGCMALGQFLAMLLGFVLTRPIRRLVRVADELRSGKLEARATVLVNDEVGQLSAAFNRLAEGIQSFQIRVRQEEEQRQVLLKRLVLSHEEERRRVALELHDELGPSLSSLRLSAGALARQPQERPAGAADLEERIGRVIAGVRRMAFLLRPSVLDDFGLPAALQRYVEDVTGQGALAVDCQIAGMSAGMRFSPEVEITLYRICQEAVTNVIRHAAARRASVVLVRQEGAVTLVVEDDGCGMDVARRTAPGVQGVGLAGMRERAHLVRGTLSVESTPGAGTVVKVIVPIREEQDADTRTHRG
jgi:signal transduction histidine kinase